MTANGTSLLIQLRRPIVAPIAAGSRFDDIHGLQELLLQTRMPLGALQLGPGALHGQLVKISSGPLEILRLRANRALVLRGTRPRNCVQCGLTLAVATDSPVPLQSQGERVGANDLFGLDPHHDTCLITPTGVDAVVMTLSRDLFAAMAAAAGSSGLEGWLIRRNTVRASAERMEMLRSLLRALLRQSLRRPASLSLPSAGQQWWLTRVTDLLRTVLAEGLEQPHRQAPPPPRFHLVQAVESWLQSHSYQGISLDQLCREVHSSRRTLIRSFREHLGIGPMQFLKLHRLHRVGEALRRGDPELSQVQSLAQLWGFLNVGNFARDYQQHFGERPSGTLRRGATPAQKWLHSPWF